MDRFHLSAYVRKRSGAFWEGAVVGHYTTAQTPDGIAVQLFGWIDGPVQIYPAAALELCDHSNSRLPPPLSSHVTSEYERQEAICTDAAMSQWERSLKRPDMQEKDRVRGAVEAYKRQALAFRMFPPAPVKHVAPLTTEQIAEIIYAEALGHDPAEKSVLASGRPYAAWASAVRAANVLSEALAPAPEKHVVAEDVRRAASALLDTLWLKAWSGARTQEENWEEMDRQFPQARWLSDALKAERAALATTEGSDNGQ